MSATLYVHPVVAIFCILCAIYALYLGLRRHFSKGASRNLHDAIGSIALGGLIVAWGVGVAQTFQNQHAFMPFATHFYIALGVLPFAIFGLASGHILAARRKGGALDRIHGIVMTAGVIWMFVTAWTGFDVMGILGMFGG